jgi:hypothetical protein
MMKKSTMEVSSLCMDIGVIPLA